MIDFKNLLNQKKENSFNFHQDSIDSFNLEKQKVIDCYLDLLRQDVGKREVGQNRGDWVDEVNMWIGAPLGSSYCLSIILHRLFLTTIKTGWKFKLPKTPSCTNFYNLCLDHLKIDFENENLKSGDIIIWKLNGSWKGHAACLENGNVTLEGNTSPPKGDQRNGDGFYRKKRNIYGFGDLKIYGVIRPTNGIFRDNKN